MAPKGKVRGLLLRWEELRDQGREVSVEELCKDFPDLIEELREQIKALKALDPVLQTRKNYDTSPSFEPGAAHPKPQTSDDSLAMPWTKVKIPGYQVLGELGRGGMGVVYRAFQIKENRPVALKMLLGGSHAGYEDRARFKAEAEAVRRLEHPNIVRVYDIGSHENRPFFSLEFVDGGTLDDKMNGEPQSPEQSAEWIACLARAVDHAHSQGVVHRDLKPANVLVTKEGVLKITDFGLAKQLDGVGPTLTRSGAIMGTPCYMAPEQAAGRTKEVGPPTDIYALGAMLYELLTGRPPFLGNNEIDTIQQVVRNEPSPPSRIRHGIPQAIEAITLKCLEKSPAKRYASAETLAADLDSFRAGRPVSAPAVTFWQHARSWSRQRKSWLRPALAGAIVIALTALVFAFGIRFGKKEEQLPPPEHTEGEIRAEAASRRQEIMRMIWSARTANGAIPPVLTEAGAARMPASIGDQSKALAAVLAAPESTTERLPDLFKTLALPFTASPPIERAGVGYGWRPEENSEFTSARPALHTARALAQALMPRNEILTDDQQREECIRWLLKTQAILKAYQPAPFDGGWNVFARQKELNDHSTSTSALALWLLLDLKKAGRPWGDDPDARDKLLQVTATWLMKTYVNSGDNPGWRESSNVTEPTYDGLTLHVYALLLRAESEARIEIRPEILARIPELLRRCAGREFSYPTSMSGQSQIAFTNFADKAMLEPNLVVFPWYPWALETAVRWGHRLERNGASRVELDEIQRMVGHWVVDFGSKAVAQARDRDTSTAATNLSGLSAVLPPSP